jgi:hypothetical protein
LHEVLPALKLLLEDQPGLVRAPEEHLSPTAKAKATSANTLIDLAPQLCAQLRKSLRCLLGLIRGDYEGRFIALKKHFDVCVLFLFVGGLVVFVEKVPKGDVAQKPRMLKSDLYLNLL